MIGYVLLALGAGVAVAFQAAANQGLARHASLGVALVTNTLVVLAGTVVLLLAQAGRAAWFPPGAPWYLYLGGAFGFAIIACAALVFPRIGAGTAIALMVFAQGAAALAIDHFGMFGMPVRPVGAAQLAGVALLVSGVVLLRR